MKAIHLIARVNIAAIASRGIASATIQIPMKAKSSILKKSGSRPQLVMSIRCRWVNDVSRKGYSSHSSVSAGSFSDGSQEYSTSSYTFQDGRSRAVSAASASNSRTEGRHQVEVEDLVE